MGMSILRAESNGTLDSGSVAGSTRIEGQPVTGFGKGLSDPTFRCLDLASDERKKVDSRSLSQPLLLILNSG